jgi:exodeoxyribonuclease VII large subunit
MKHILTVSEINKYIKEILSRDFILSSAWVKGEISNYKNHYSGHMYFTLKDETSIIKAVMFKTHASNLKFEPENGLKVIIKGNVAVFERDGQYQLYVEDMQPDGIGNLHLAFEQLKRRLELEGLFDSKYKKRLPLIPESICVVTSSTGSVIRDIIHVLSRRFPNIHIKIYPVAVQGESASKQISYAIKKVNEFKCADVIIIARGGGSLEELWAFNEEIVARSIYESNIPIISAVGHETDYTIADFVADLRAPTPSAAAEIVVPEKAILKDRIKNLNSRLLRALYNKMNLNRKRLSVLTENRVFTHPYDRIYQERMRLIQLDKYLNRGFLENSNRIKSNFSKIVGKLNALSPLNTLARGYSVAKHKENGSLIKSISQVMIDDNIELELNNGKIDCIVKSVNPRID